MEFSLVVLYHVAAGNVVAGVGQYSNNDRRQSAVGGVTEKERSTNRGLCLELFVFCMQGKIIDYSHLLSG